MLILKRLAHSLPPNHITFAAKSLLKVWFKALLLHRVSDYGMNNGKPYKSSAHSGGFHSHGFGRAKGAYAGGKLGGKPAKSRDQEHRGRRHSSKSSSSSSSSTGRKQRKLERAQKYLLKHDRVYQDMVRQAEQQERSKALEGQGAILAKALQESLDKSVQLAVNVCTPSVDAATGSPSTSTSPSQGGQPFPPGPPGTNNPASSAGGRSEGASKGDGGGKAECDTLSQNQLALLSSELQHKCTFANGSISAVTEAILAKPAGDRIFTGLLNTVITRYAGWDIPRNREARARAAFYAVQNV